MGRTVDLSTVTGYVYRIGTPEQKMFRPQDITVLTIANDLDDLDFGDVTDPYNHD